MQKLLSKKKKPRVLPDVIELAITASLYNHKCSLFDVLLFFPRIRSGGNRSNIKWKIVTE